MPDDIQLPGPRCTYADHSYPAYDAQQVREILRADRERQQWQPIGTLECHVSGAATFWPDGARVLHLPVGDHTVYVAPPADAKEPT